MNRTRTLLIIGVFMLSLAVLAALEFRVQDEPPSEGQMVTGSLSKDMPALKASAMNHSRSGWGSFRRKRSGSVSHFLPDF